VILNHRPGWRSINPLKAQWLVYVPPVLTYQNSGSHNKQHYPVWLCNGDVMCFLWGTKWMYICHLEEIKVLGSILGRCTGYSELKNTIFWDITPRSPLKVNRRFGGTYRLHLQGRRISRARNQPESRWLGKNAAIVARQRLGRNVTAVTNTYATIEEFLDASFSMWPVSYQGK
jgi:hypothetical protein